MIKRWLRMLACVGLFAFAVPGCNVYDPPDPAANPAGRSGNGAGMSGSGGEPVACVPSDEVCNDKDDDCNGVVDDAEPASRDCSLRYHARVDCGPRGFCLFVSSNPMCDLGRYHCDGMPQNGCESTTPCCPMCEDGGADGATDDSGTDDAGTL